MHPDLTDLVVARDRPDLRNAIRATLRRGAVRPVLRGIYAPTESAGDFTTRLRALGAADPDSVGLGATASAVHGWRVPHESEVIHASSWRIQGPHPGYRLTRRAVPPEHRLNSHGGAFVTDAALTTLDLAREAGPDAIDDALRRGVALAQLHRALGDTPNVGGNRRLARYLFESRDEPWSAAERVAHAALHRRRVTGWTANYRVELPSGEHAFLDIGFRQLRLGLEIDGFQYHHSHRSFVHDRLRDLALTNLGWQLVRFPASWVMDDPDRFAGAVDVLRRAAHRARFGTPHRRP